VLFAIVALVTLPPKESPRMTRAEQDTIIRYSPDEDVVHVFTAHPPTHRKLAKDGYRAGSGKTAARLGMDRDVELRIRWRDVSERDQRIKVTQLIRVQLIRKLSR
jgi:hypothetical protein